MSDWQPIETKPDNTDPVLVWFEGGLQPVLVYHNLRGWRISGVGYIEIKPTHWMPLPEPPQ